MTADDEVHLEVRIRERAFQIWLDEGKPEGREKGHWEIAKLAIAHEDGMRSALVEPHLPLPEPFKAVQDQISLPEQTVGNFADKKNV